MLSNVHKKTLYTKKTQNEVINKCNLTETKTNNHKPYKTFNNDDLIKYLKSKYIR